MNLINQTGFYHGVITDAGLSQSTGGFPQEVMVLKALKVYDPDSESYLPADPEANEITTYLVLIDSKDRETRNSQQLKKITGWDGASFVTLSEMNMVDMPVAFRVEENTFNENTTLKVTWVDTLDAAPTRTVQKLDAKDVQALQARYAQVLASTKVAAKPVSAKTVNTLVHAPIQTLASVPTPTLAPETPKASDKPKVGRPPKGTPKLPKATVVGKCSADDAYTACYSLKRDDVTDDALNEAWLKAVAAVNEDESKITEEQWFQIKEVVLRQTSKV
jgi:hypothetical protein